MIISHFRVYKIVPLLRHCARASVTLCADAPAVAIIQSGVKSLPGQKEAFLRHLGFAVLQ